MFHQFDFKISLKFLKKSLGKTNMNEAFFCSRFLAETTKYSKILQHFRRQFRTRLKVFMTLLT